MVPHRLRVSPLHAVILLWHVVHSEDAENDADRTVPELINDLDVYEGWVSKAVIESALYCCNMENERGKFWHPLNHDFDKFLKSLLKEKVLHFDKYYNVIYELRKDGTKEKPKND